MPKTKLLFLAVTTLLNSVAYAAEQQIQELEEIVVFGSGTKHAGPKSAKPAISLSGDQLKTNLGQTLGDTLQNQMGITNQSFGTGVGVPVIRG